MIAHQGGRPTETVETFDRLSLKGGHPKEPLAKCERFSLKERRLGQILSEVIKDKGRPEKSVAECDTFSLKDISDSPSRGKAHRNGRILRPFISQGYWHPKEPVKTFDRLSLQDIGLSKNESSWFQSE